MLDHPDIRKTESASADAPQTTGVNDLQKWVAPLALGCILLLGAIFRFTGVNWDDYQHLHPDERFLTMVETALRWPGDPALQDELKNHNPPLPPGCRAWGGYFDTACSPLNPYNRGQTSFVYGTFPLFLVKWVGDVVSQTGYDEIHLVGRYLSGLFDLFSVLLIFFIARRLFGTRVGLLAALLLSASVLDIQQSHFFTVDTFANVPLLLSFWFTLDIFQGRRGWMAYVLAGLFFGLSLAARINLAPFAAIIALAAFYRFIHALRREPALPNPPPSASHVFAYEADSLGEPDRTSPEPGPRVRAANLGPLSIQVEAQRQRPAESGAGTLASAGLGWLELGLVIALELAIAAVAAVLAFRIAQPYAFKGLGFNPQFVADMNYARDLIAGNLDVPPMHQWTARPDYWFPYVNMLLWGLGPGLGLAATAGFLLAGFELIVRRVWAHLLAFFWVGGLFLYLGQQMAKTDRYYLPLYPFAALLAAYFLIRLWDWAPGRWQSTRESFLETATPEAGSSAAQRPHVIFRVLAASALLAAAGYTLFWAAAFTSIYTRPVSRVTASRWIYQNVPRGATLGNEHWDDPLPLRVDGKDGFAGYYKGVELQWYGEDTPEKRDQAILWLDSVDYINLTSNRLYLSIPRLPVRYPLTTEYYRWLFEGRLGFTLIQTVTSRPSFLGIEINDDDAEESFTVYDHPKVLIFAKTAQYSHENTAALFNSADLTDVIRQKPLDATLSHQAFQLPSNVLQDDRAGGTWAEIFNPDDLANRIPVIVWLLLLELLGLILFPVSFFIFRRFADRGYAFAKALGVLALGWGAWTLAGYHLLPFSRESILLVLATLIVVAVALAFRSSRELWAFLRARWSLLFVEELVFFGFFLLSLLIRYGNPDLWHPSFGGEKPMDFAYLNAIIKTSWFPAYNPWFAGGYINYYYFGQLLSATLVRLIGIVPEVAYNLLLPMFFSLTALGAFGVALNLLMAIRGSRSEPEQGDAEGKVRLDAPGIGAILTGLFAAFLVLVIGNLGEVGVLASALTRLGGGSGPSSLLKGLGAWLVGNQAIPMAIGDWYWTATRVIPDTINEFPFFTFLYADLHAHLMALAFTLVALALALHAVLLRGRLKWYDLGGAGLVLGALRPTNTWDYPTYLALLGGGLVLGVFAEPRGRETGERAGGWLAYLCAGILVFVQIMLAVIPINALGVKITIDVLIYVLILIFGLTLGWIRDGSAFRPDRLVSVVGWRMIALVILSAVFYYPYLAFYGEAYTSIELWKGARTNLQEYLTVWGLFVFMVGTYLVVANLRPFATRPAGSMEPLGGALSSWWVYGLGGAILLAFVLVVLNLAVLAVVLPLVVLGAWLFFRRETVPELRFLTLLALGALLLTAMVEVITLKGDIGRMNTVFKFYLQAWVLFAIVSAVGLSLIWDRLALWPHAAATAQLARGQEIDLTEAPARPPMMAVHSQGTRQVWWAAFALLLFAGLLYPAFATWAKVNDRYVPKSPPGLNGMSYMNQATYEEKGQVISLAPDRAAIDWMREHIQGSPVVVEANTGLYRWGDRVSIYTGLPTVIGWDWHTKQQYALLDGSVVDQRLAEVAAFYNNADPSSIKDFLKRYAVSYIYIGPLERAVYQPEGLSKFEALAQAGELTKVYDSGKVQIYEVNSALAFTP